MTDADSASETPVGEYPRTGGPMKIHPNRSARDKKYRARKEERERAALAAGIIDPGPASEPVSPDLAVPTLTELLAQFRRTHEAFTARFEAAVAGLADPDAVVAAIAASESAAAEQMAAATARAAEANSRRLAAETEAREATQRMTEAEEVADELVAQVDDLERRVETLEGELAEERLGRAADVEQHRVAREADAAAHAEAIDTINRDHASAMETLNSEHSAVVERLEQAHAEKVTALAGEYQRERDELAGLLTAETAARSRFEGEAWALRDELTRTQTELEELRGGLPALIEGAREDLRSTLAARHAAELDAAAARAETDLVRLQGELATALARLEAAHEQLNVKRARSWPPTGPGWVDKETGRGRPGGGPDPDE